MKKHVSDFTESGNFSADSLKTISTKNLIENLSFREDGRFYYGDTVMSNEEQVKAMRKGNLLPRFNLFAMFRADNKVKMKNIYTIWKSENMPDSNIMFDLARGTVTLAFHSSSDDTTANVLYKYKKYFVKGKSAFCTVEQDELVNLPEDATILQRVFDEQTSYDFDGYSLFPHKLGLMMDKGWVLPFSTIVEDDKLKIFTFDQVA